MNLPKDILDNNLIIKLDNIDYKETLLQELCSMIDCDMKDICFVNLSKRGENNRGNGFEGKGSISCEDIEKCKFIFGDAINIESQQETFINFVILSVKKKAIFITNKKNPKEVDFKMNPALRIFCPCNS